MPALPTDILAKVLEALRTHRNARRAAKLVGVNQATAWRIAKKHGIALISRAEHMKARRVDPAFVAKQAPAAREAASNWLKAQHAKPKFHKKSIEAARRNLTHLNGDPAFRQASSERLKRLHEDPAFGAKLDAARHTARKRRQAQLREKAIEAALRTLTRLDDDSAFRLAAGERLNRLLHGNPGLRAKEAAVPRPARNRGFAIAPILYLLGLIGVGAGVLFSGYSQILRSNQTMSNTLASKNDLQGTATTLAASSWLSTDQTLLCPPMIGSNSPSAPSAKCSSAPGAITVGTSFASAVAGNLPANYASVSGSGSPVEVGVFAAGSGAKVLDPWGHYYIYCRWENPIGTANAIMVISAGANGKLETKCGDTVAQGDDLFVVWTTAVTQNRAAVWQTTTAGTSVTGAQFGATGTQVNIQTNGDVSIPGTLGVTGATALGTGGLSVTGATTLAGVSASSGTFSGAVSATSGAFSGSLSATGTTTLGALSAGTSTLSSLTVSGNGTVGGTLGVTGATTLGALTAGSSTLSSLSVTGATYLGGNASTSTGVVQIGTSVSASGTSSGLLTVGKSVSGVYPFIVDQYGAVSGGAFTGTTFTGNLVGNQSGGSVAATTLSASGATTLNSTLGVTGVTTLSAQLNGTSAIFSGNVQAGSFTGTMSLGGGGVTLSGIVPISNGGTGQTSAANALSALFSGAGTVAQMIPGADLVNNSVTTTQLSTTGVAAGTYSSVTVGLDGRVTSGSGSGGVISTINDGSGDSVSVGTSGISYAIGSAAVGNWSSTGLMIGSSSPALDRLDVYGATAIGTGYAGTTAAPANGLIVQGKVGIGTAGPVTTVTVGTPLQSTSDFNNNTPRQFEINDLYTNTAAGQYSTMSIFAQAGATASGTSADTALQVDNLVPSTETYNFGNKIGIRSEANNAGSGTATSMYGAQLYGFYGGSSSTANTVAGSQSFGENTANGTVSSAFGAINEAMNVGTGSINQAFGAENYDYNSSTGTVTQGWGILNRVNNVAGGTIGTAYGEEDQVYNSGTGTMSTAYGIIPHVNNLSSGAISAAYGVDAYVSNGAGTMTTAYGIYDYLVNSGTMASWYGFYIPAITGTTPATAYDLYIADANNNYFAGNVGIGTAIPLDTLDINGTGIHIASGTPSSTTNALYNNAGTLTWNGVALGTSGGGGSLSGGLANNVALWTSGTAIGTSNMYQSNGGFTIGYASGTMGPTNGLMVKGNVGIGNIAPANTLDVGGGTAIGSYAGVTGAPTNGLIVSGDVGIGTASPLVNLDIAPAAVSNVGGVLYIRDNTGVNGTLKIANYNGANYIESGLTTAGSSAAPLYFTNMGAGSIRMTIGSTGNVGIGTAVPMDTLDINGTGIHIASGTPSSTTNALYNNAGTLTWNGVALGTSGGASLSGGLANNVALWTSATAIGTSNIYQSSGNIGIGTTPDTKLTIVAPGAGNAALHIPAENGNTGFKINRPYANNSSLEWYGSGTSLVGQIVDSSNMNANGPWAFNGLSASQTPLTINGFSGQSSDIFDVFVSGNSTPVLNVASGGKVGIGSSSPAATLDVNGSVQIANGQNLTFNYASNSGIQFYPGTTINRRASDGSLLLNSSQANIVITPAVYTVFASGNVGIGTTVPNDTLDTNGGLHVEGAVFPSGGAGLEFGYGSPASTTFIQSYNRAGSAWLAGYIDAQKLILNSQSGGNVGIGVTGPGAPLEVRGTSASYASNAGHLALTTASSTNGLRFGVYDSNYSWISSFNSLPLYINTGGNNTVLNASGGSVGIGTTVPYALFDVQTASNQHIAIRNWSSTAQLLAMTNGAASYANMLIDGSQVVINSSSGGFVGIGQTSPSYKLDVNGTAGFQTSLYGNGKDAIDTGDTYLRINQNSTFSSGIWFGSSPLMEYQGHIYVGSQGGAGEVDISGTSGDATNRITINGNSGANSWFNTGGNVGIGTTSPGSTLEVNGHIKSLKTYQTGSVAVNGSGTWQTVTFPTAFSSTPVVTGTMSNLVGGYYGFVVVNGGTLSTTSFQFIVVTMQNAVDVAGDTISWIAVAQ